MKVLKSLPRTMIGSLGISTAALLLLCCQANAQSRTYINYAPESSRVSADQDSRITLLPDKGLFGSGHDYGEIHPCAGNGSNCFAFDFMALRSLPGNADVGSSYLEGIYSFRVSRVVNLSLIGQVHRTLRVEVMKDGTLANSYLFERERGVIAILVPNFGLKSIPESIFFLEGDQGVFAEQPE